MSAAALNSWNGWLASLDALEPVACETRERLVNSISVALAMESDGVREFNDAGTEAEAGAIAEKFLHTAAQELRIVPLRTIGGPLVAFDLFVRRSVAEPGATFMAPDGTMGRLFTSKEAEQIVEWFGEIDAGREAWERSERETRARWAAMTHEERVAEVEQIRANWDATQASLPERHRIPCPDADTALRNLNAARLRPEAARP